MEFLAVLAVIVVIGVPVSVVVLIVQVLRLRDRVAALEGAIAGVRAGLPDAAETATAAPASAVSGAEAGGDAAAGPAEAGAPGPWAMAATQPSGPEAAVPPDAAPEPEPAGGPSQGMVLARWLGWATANWFYLVSALSLGLAGVFLVQYGIENGLLSPAMRVSAAIALGLGLMAAGEVLRRRGGDTGPGATAQLPSTFSAAGIVAVYAGILAARALYGLVGPGPAFAGLVATGAAAVVFGWLYGPFLGAAGLVGAAAAPWLVGGDPGAADFLSAYYALLGGVALAVDAMRRWGWVSALGLVLAFLGGRLALEAGAGLAGHAAMLAALAVMAACLPRLELWPSHPGPALLPALAARHPGATSPPVRIAWAAMAAAVALMLGALPGGSADAALLVAGLLTALGVVAALATRRASGLVDLAAAPLAGFLALLVLEPVTGGALFRAFAAFVPADAPEVAPPATVTLLTALGAALAAALALRGGAERRLLAAAAAATVVAVPVLIELFWTPAAVIGPGRWAFHVAALAAAATFAAERWARADGEDRGRAALAALAVLTLVALALFIILSATALTVALAALVVAAAALDRRFDLPEVVWALHAGVAVILWRLLVDPGLDAHVEVLPLAEVILAHAAALAGLAAARVLLRPDRPRAAAAALEAGFLAVAALLAAILLHRAVRELAPPEIDTIHWEPVLLGLAWLAAALAEAWRARAETGWLALARRILAGLMALPALAFLVLALVPGNPWWAGSDTILGPQPLDTLALGYGLPAVVFLALARYRPLPRLVPVFTGLAALYGAVWLFLAIRRFWHGAVMAYLGFTDPELYSYTVALLLVGAVVFYRSLATGRAALRRMAMALIGLAVVKVFLVDAADMAGLLRVFSFLFLGLALAGLAWLNRWAVLRQSGTGPGPGQAL